MNCDQCCGSGIFIPDPNIYPSRISDPGVKKPPDPVSGPATLIERLLCRERRQMVYERVVLKYGFKCLFLESICDSTELIEANIMDIKVSCTQGRT
jgi:hypothetical protein